MCEMRRLKNVVIYNPMEPLGLLDDEADEEQILQLWGMDPTEAACKAIGNHLMEAIISHVAEARSQAAAAEESKKSPRLPRRQSRNQ